MDKSPIYNRIDADLELWKQESRFRTVAPVNDRALIDCASNSYLSLHNNDDVAAEAASLAGNCLSGNVASRLITTNSPLYPVLEQDIADWKKTEASLVFNSGYAANVGIISALATRDTEIFCDRLNHASIIDGIKLSGALLNRYVHCDMQDLEMRLKASKKKEKLIVTDSVFSMDGNVAPLAAICSLAKKYNCMVMVDEAHATGIYGNTLCGLVEECKLQGDVDIVMGTLSKSVAGLGGYFAGSQRLKDYFVNSSRSFIYSTALPHSVLAHNIAAIRYIRAHRDIGNFVRQKADSLRSAMKVIGHNYLNSTSQIVPCIIGEPEDALALSRYLAEHGIKAPAIRPPTVPVHTARIRFSVHLGLSQYAIAKIVDVLAAWKRQNG